jgi:hypothetical protein
MRDPSTPDANDDKDLFGAHTRARKDDRWTSKAAASRIVPTLNEKQAKVLAIHRQYQKGLTNWELEILAGSHNSTWRTRVSELVQMGVIVDSRRTKKISDSDDPRSERTIFICREYADPYLFEPMPDQPPPPPPPTNAHYNMAGQLIHDKCAICGKDAAFGVGVFLSKGHLGMWYCKDHKPK